MTEIAQVLSTEQFRYVLSYSKEYIDSPGLNLSLQSFDEEIMEGSTFLNRYRVATLP